MEQAEFPNTPGGEQDADLGGSLRLFVTLDVRQGYFSFQWFQGGSPKAVARGLLAPTPGLAFPHFMLQWELETEGRTETDGCGSRGTSARALVNRLRKRLPVPDACLEVRLVADRDLGQVKAGLAYKVVLPRPDLAWKWLASEVQQFARLLEGMGVYGRQTDPEKRGPAAALALARSWLGVPSNPARGSSNQELFPPTQNSGLQVCITLEIAQGFVQLDWSDPESGQRKASGWIRCTESDELTWSLELEGRRESTTSSHHLNSIRGTLLRWAARFPTNPDLVSVFSVRRQPHGGPPLRRQEHPLPPGEVPWDWLSDNVKTMAGVMRANFSPLAKVMNDLDPLMVAEMERDQRRFLRKERKREEEAARLRRTWSAWPRSAAAASNAPRRQKGLLKPRKPREGKLTMHLRPPSTARRAFAAATRADAHRTAAPRVSGDDVSR